MPRPGSSGRSAVAIVFVLLLAAVVASIFWWLRPVAEPPELWVDEFETGRAVRVDFSRVFLDREGTPLPPGVGVVSSVGHDDAIHETPLGRAAPPRSRHGGPMVHVAIRIPSSRMHVLLGLEPKTIRYWSTGCEVAGAGVRRWRCEPQERVAPERDAAGR